MIYESFFNNKMVADCIIYKFNKNQSVIGGFDFNGVINGVKARRYHGPHKEYTEMIRNYINNLDKNFNNCSPEEAKALLEEVAKIFKNTINNNY